MHASRQRKHGSKGSSGGLPALNASRVSLPELEESMELPMWARKVRKERQDPRDVLAQSTGSSASRNRMNHRNLPARWGTKSLRSSTDSLRSSLKRDLKDDVKPFPYKKEKYLPGRPPSSIEITYDQEDRSDSAAASAPAPKDDEQNDIGLLIELAGPGHADEIAALLRSTTPLSKSEGFLRLDQSKLPLEMFDNTEFEKFSPDEWLQICSTGQSPYYSAGAWRWESCDILDYDEESDRYLIAFRSSGKQKYVKRVNLLFDAEDRINFCNRLQAALISRERTKAAIRLQHFIDQQRPDGATPVADEWLSNILEHATAFKQRYTARQRDKAERMKQKQRKRQRERSKRPDGSAELSQTLSKSKSGPALDVRSADGSTAAVSAQLADAAAASPLLSTLFAEVVQEYDISMKTTTLFRELQVDEDLQANYQELRLPPPPPSKPAQYYGKVEIPGSIPGLRRRWPVEDEEAVSERDRVILQIPATTPSALSLQFKSRHGKLGNSIVFRSPIVLRVIQHTVDVWERGFSSASFVDTSLEGLEMPCALSDFKQRQRDSAKLLVTRLANDWRRAVSNSLLDDATQVYNFYETNVDAHLSSDLHRLIRLIEIIMGDQLQGLVAKTCHDWQQFFQQFSPEKHGSVEADAAGSDDGESKSDDVAETTGHPSAPRSDLLGSVWCTPLFNVELILGHDGQVGFSPSVEDIHQVLIGGLSTMITNVRACKQIEQDLLSLCRFPGESAPLLNIVVNDPLCAEIDQVVSTAKAEIKRMLREDMQAPFKLVDALNQYTYICALDPAAFVSEFMSTEKTADEIFAKISEFDEATRVVSTMCSSIENFGLCRLHTHGLQTLLSDKALELRNGLLTAVVDVMKTNASSVDDEYSVILARISEKPSNEKELVELREFIKASERTVRGLVKQTDHLHWRMDKLGDYNFKISHSLFKHFWSIKQWPLRVAMTTEESLAALEADKQRMMEQLEKDKLEFEALLEALDKRVKQFKEAGNASEIISVMDIANSLEADLRNAFEKADELNNREQVFGFTATEYISLQLTQDEFEPFFKLWSALSDFSTKKQIWITGPFVDLRVQAPDIERDVKEWWTMSYKLMKSLADKYPGAAEVAKLLREETNTFMSNIPVIQALASPALEDRHWDELSEKVGKTLVSDDELTLQLLLDDGIMDHLDAVQEVYVKAQKEFNLKRDLKAMKDEWDDTEFETMAYKDSGTFVIKGVDEVMTLLDDQIVKVQTMMGHPFIKPILPETKAWERRLLHTQALIDEWLAVQRTWMYLEPIFGSEDIMRQMPVEGRRFGNVDSLWRKTMGETAEFPRVMDAATREKLLDQFKNANKLLDQIQKGLNDYLEVKRLHFPRFFFLSNDELLEILSQTKEPRAVQPHLGKCFEGLAKVAFRGDETGNKDDVTIIRLVSAENEQVEMLKTVDPNKGDNKGNVEKWLLQLLGSMRLTVKDVCTRAMHAYPESPRPEWVLSWPGQVVLNISQLFWTSEVEEAIRTGGNKGLAEYGEVLNKQLHDIVDLVRGGLTKMERITLGALCVIDVHARDVVANMIKKNVEVVSDFEWMSQLRYYWENHPDDYNRYGEDPNNLMVRIVNAQQMYGYEYLGNSSRLVITPLTDRCYRTLMGAVSLMYGGAPAGPAGTGKTETTKDLAKAVAIQCVVFNCSDGLDYLAMAKFFKGLAASGAWACFDEFNRIELEVLSVVAQQILTITKARRGRVSKFVFEGSTISLNPDCNVFITMNPGYAGRSELPDNLKALFRPCAMMVPDYSMIAEIKLYSFGFTDARNMARKLTQVLQLSSEQLSSQKHYDYGMRAVFSILVRAGNLRQQLGDSWTEDLIVLSSINDVNLPKFTTNDIPLFRGITRDLFPGVVLPQPDYEHLLGAIRDCSVKAGLQPKDEFIRSTVQLFETVQVRHGLMVVGKTCSGKTQVIRTLAAAMTALSDREDFDPVHLHAINPKSITQGQLYGNFDDNTHEWTDGVLAVKYRSCAKDTTTDRHWIVFDGPVDAVWIENMNTVLDDNKKLCLNSGEIIKMSSHMTMMFEAEDLEEASPATVSRCGMVYMEPRRVGWRPTVKSWLDRIVHPCNAHTPLGNAARKAEMYGLFEWLVPPTLFCIQNYCPHLCPVTDLELVASLVNLFDSLLSITFGIRDPRQLSEDALSGDPPALPDDCPKDKDVTKVLDALFIESVVWSIGIVTDTKGRKTFDQFLRAMIGGKATESPIYADFFAKNPMYDAIYQEGGRALAAFNGDIMLEDLLEGETQAEGAPEPDMFGQRACLKPVTTGAMRVAAAVVPDDGLVYDFQANGSKGGWTAWSKLMDRFSIPAKATFNSIMVPTIDSFRNNWLMDVLCTHGHHVLCVGDTGTGKSVQMIDKLMNGMNKEVYQPLFMNFSAQTSANQTQSIIDGKMSRRRKGVYGPPLGQRYIVFVDDLNMPAKETYGAQPPIELLRQWMDHGGWYDLADKDLQCMNLVDIQFVAAMGPPGGGRTRITQRYVRHFNIIGYVPLSVQSLETVFSTILNWSVRDFSTSIKSAVSQIVSATIDVYDTIAAELLPTPAKSHYTFNLRDLSKVFQGMNQASADAVGDQLDLVRLWAHECMRVFHDRLVDDVDRTWFKKLVADKVKEHFKKDWEKDVRGSNETLIYGNFVGSGTSYQEIADRPSLKAAMDEFLEDYNNMSTKQMNLVLFMNAIEHVARISRVINLPSGNALLVGVGGSGRKSLTTLATFMCDYALFQVEISKAYGMTEWRDDLKRMLMQAGKDGKPTVFLFSDTQIVSESFVEDINNILNNGEVPNVWEPDERNMILEDCRTAASQEGLALHTPQEVFGYFVDRCKNNLHVVLCFSPIGDAFRTRLRMFPSLVNCCTIDWFTEWPREALQSVATYFMDSIDLPEDTKKGVIDVCVDMQTLVTDMSHRFLSELRRHYYVTPTSYLELINTFKDLIGKKQDEVLGAKARYENGLDKLKSTEEQVKVMQVELEELQPQLKVASKETEEMLKKISVMQVEANEKAEVVGKEEKDCAVQAASAQAMKDECEGELAEAVPALENSIKALKTLKKSDISEVKAMQNPPGGVKVTMGAVCIMMQLKPKKIPNPDGKGKVDDYWEVAKKNLLGDTKFLDRLMSYPKDDIPDDVIEKVSAYKDRDDFQPATVEKASKAAGGLCKWVHAMLIYNRVAKVVAPKRAALKEATASLEAAQATLAGKQAELKEVQDRVAGLQDELKVTMDKKDSLEKQVDDCSKKLDRAQRLIGGLGGEKSRWTEAAIQLQAQYDNVVGDIVLSAGLIAYLGAFTSSYRDECITAWSEKLRAKNIPCAEHYSLADTLGDAVQVRAWTIAKLPNDSFSIDNAIMLYKSNRWPLMIDPQGQANKWVRNTEGERGLKIVKQNQSNFVRTIENAVQFGVPVLLENVPETLDPVLESVLSRQIVKQGGMMTIRVGDNTVEYDPKFRLYITTKLRNPHYSPEICVQLNLLNFMATSEGLEDQMLGIAVKKERPDLEEQRERLILEDAENKRKLKEIEDKILALLAASEGNILDDEELIQTLGESKVTSNQIMAQVAKAEKTQAKINTAREGYQPVAKRASLLFFCIADLASVDPMYQYSLEWFVNLFLLAIDKAEAAKEFEVRLQNLNDTFTLVLYRNVCRSLFEKDKLLFSFLLCIKILLGGGDLDPSELQFFLQGSLSMDLAKPNPTADLPRQWLENKNWADIMALSHLPAFDGFADEFAANIAQWEQIFNSTAPAQDLEERYSEKFNMFQILLILRCIRPDKVVPFIQRFVAASIGEQFIDPPTFDLTACYDDSRVTSPLIFVLSPGADPMTELLKLADKMGKSKQLFSVSLGQGQGQIAENAISEAVDKGTWVCLQNCHLAESWMPTLERVCEEITAENTNDSFRLWLTAMPNDKFPVSILQNGVKMTLEPPKGMRANLLGSYSAMDTEWFDSCSRPGEFKKLVFGLCFFHAIVRERRKFGPLGWNIPYEFSEPDLRISLDQLKIFLDDVAAYPEVPYEALAYLVGECNYGGRVTDDKDRRCILNILSDFYTPDIQKPGYTFSQSGIYYAPPTAPHETYVEYIRQLPYTETPEVFGLHDNADITCAISETNQLLTTALSLQPRRSTAGGKSADEELLELASDIANRLPELFDIEQVQVDYPVKFEESMNTVLTQELIRFNRLLAVVKKSLVDIQKAIKGIVVMSADLESLGNSMVKGFVPDMWKAVSYPSLKPLGSYVNDLLARLEFFAKWIKHDKPMSYWISGFFFTQSFLTGTRQNFARKYTIPIDEIAYDFRVLTPEESTDITVGPDDGCFVYGVYLEGARWDTDHGALAESRPRELYIEMPCIHLLPKKETDIDETQHVYSCPVYKTSERRGALSTTGHSTNFVMMIWLPMSKQHDAKYWIKKGVAMLTQLDT